MGGLIDGMPDPQKESMAQRMLAPALVKPKWPHFCPRTDWLRVRSWRKPRPPAPSVRLDIKAGAAKLKADLAARLEAEAVVDRWNRRLSRDMLCQPSAPR
jgi:hypothetical protein